MIYTSQQKNRLDFFLLMDHVNPFTTLLSLKYLMILEILLNVSTKFHPFFVVLGKVFTDFCPLINPRMIP